MQCTTALAGVSLCGLLALLSCRQDIGGGLNNPLSAAPDVSPVGQVLGTAVPLAYAATMAMAAMNGSRLPCVSVTGGSTPPCSATVTVTVGSGCMLPLGSVGNGAIIVNGFWRSPDSATLTAVFEGVSIGGQALFVRQGAFVASLSGDTITTVYADQNIGLTTSNTAQVSQSAWTVTVNTNHTLSDPSDDTMTINGTREYVVGASVSDVALVNTMMLGICTRNPISGTAVIDEVSGSTPDVVGLSFHNTCDGTALVTGTIHVTWINKNISLNLLN